MGRALGRALGRVLGRASWRVLWRASWGLILGRFLWQALWGATQEGVLEKVVSSPSRRALLTCHTSGQPFFIRCSNSWKDSCEEFVRFLFSKARMKTVCSTMLEASQQETMAFQLGGVVKFHGLKSIKKKFWGASFGARGSAGWPSVRKPKGLDSEPFLKPIGSANSTRGQP